MHPDPDISISRQVMEDLIAEGSEAFGAVLEKLLNAAMQVERSVFLQAVPYERTEERRGYANGYKPKRLKTRVGELQLEIPQVRGLSFYPQSLEKGCRSEKALKLAIAEMYVTGVSTRKVTEITQQLCGTEISATQVSRLAQFLDEELEKFRQRSLGSYPMIFLDAHYERVRIEGTVRELAVLKAIGINRFGKREILGVSISLSEAEVHWRQFLEDLQKRGLSGVVLFVSDDHSGLGSARRGVFPSVRWQRCQFHLSQNAQHFAHRREERNEISRDIRDIFNSPTRSDAEAMLKRKVEAWSKRNPRLSEWMGNHLVEGFTVFDFPRNLQRRLRTVNAVENLNKQIRRRTRVVGIFPNKESALRLITAVLQEIHEEWITGKQYLNLSSWRASGSEKEVACPQYLEAVG